MARSRPLLRRQHSSKNTGFPPVPEVIPRAMPLFTSLYIAINLAFVETARRVDDAVEIALSLL